MGGRVMMGAGVGQAVSAAAVSGGTGSNSEMPAPSSREEDWFAQPARQEARSRKLTTRRPNTPRRRCQSLPASIALGVLGILMLIDSVPATQYWTAEALYHAGTDVPNHRKWLRDRRFSVEPALRPAFAARRLLKYNALRGDGSRQVSSHCPGAIGDGLINRIERHRSRWWIQWHTP